MALRSQGRLRDDLDPFGVEDKAAFQVVAHAKQRTLGHVQQVDHAAKAVEAMVEAESEGGKAHSHTNRDNFKTGQCTSNTRALHRSMTRRQATTSPTFNSTKRHQKHKNKNRSKRNGPVVNLWRDA